MANMKKRRMTSTRREQMDGADSTKVISVIFKLSNLLASLRTRPILRHLKIEAVPPMPKSRFASYKISMLSVSTTIVKSNKFHESLK